MGILTTRESATSFSSYVTAFGIALLISSISYLKRLDNSDEKIHCISTEQSAAFDLPPTCTQIDSWRTAAIVGIIIGVIDTLIVPFLLCCCISCTVCGCALCCKFGCLNIFPDNETKAESTTRNGDAELTETTTINVEDNDQPTTASKYDVENVPSKLHVWLNAFGWILWVVGPFVATLYIVIVLYKYDAIRTRNDDLFGSALVLFVIALFNLMVYFQKFINSLCGYGHKKVTTK
ncbi:uncharacterized protein LOC119070630 [Bradysia coprophila]|uniref:uncharacterized protein LOC119070630 n=1 Tax=Bradysia coprophila TaxID=38358 RepID=UPI00187D8207|nr:uncharacterized protein LOC119070630 [Bradysia coprophila]XP_037030951.1 uncharacterized protein LOC119070630 [Bradysia coprophila]XP_037030952.1 uncharacterized protein LOC119070630 [Bradysia coprophila]XP_037030953.1 uncharacterized protein LOC119070630 [Bradysia coprophila]XP_037030954.1 uncharacterized protein LOC119070630 [Bradysia coprophila]XP_037030955.1 uncharacterized protein LOC119070630 [Bradysia coprophila]